MSDMITRTTQLTVMKKGGAIYDETAYRVDIDDESAGEFIKLWANEGSVSIDFEDWPDVRDAIERIYNEILANEVTE